MSWILLVASVAPYLSFACLTLQTTFAALFWVKSPSLVCSTFTGQVSDLFARPSLVKSCTASMLYSVTSIAWMQRLPNSVGSILAAWFVLSNTEHHFHLLNSLDGFRHWYRHRLHQTFLLTTKHHLLQQLGCLWASYCWNQFWQDPFGSGSIGSWSIYTPVILADLSGSGSCTPGILTLVFLIFSTCLLSLRRLKYKTPLTTNMSVDNVTLVWYCRISVGTSTTFCLANGGLQCTISTTPHLVAESSALYLLQQSHCYYSPTWALVLPTGFKMDTLYTTP